MRLQAATTESIKAKADRYYKAQCKRIAEERRVARELAHSPAAEPITPSQEAFIATHGLLHQILATPKKPARRKTVR